MDGKEDEAKSAKRRRKDPVKKKEASNGPSPAPMKFRTRPPPVQAQDLTAVPRGPQFIEVEPGQYLTEEHPHNKRGFRYLHCAPNPPLSSVLYQVVETPPFCARASFEDRSPQVLISKEGDIVSTNRGFRSARANVGVREGEWYVEFKVVKGNDDSGAHVRLGFARREASLEAPVGHDAYGYGVRDMTGDKVHISRPVSFMKEPFRTGDVIGMRIRIPRTAAAASPHDVYRDRIPIRYKGQLYFEMLDYVPTKAMSDLLLPSNVFKKKQNAQRFVPEKIPGSFIRVYKNGRDMGVAFEDLNEFLPPHSKFQPTLSQREADDGQLGYYPMISVFSGGKAEFNFGPAFECPPEDGLGVARPLADRYDEQIADDIVFDIIDQVDYEITDRLEDEALARIKESSSRQTVSPQPAVVAKVEEIADANDASQSLEEKLHEQQKQAKPDQSADSAIKTEETEHQTEAPVTNGSEQNYSRNAENADQMVATPDQNTPRDPIPGDSSTKITPKLDTMDTTE